MDSRPAPVLGTRTLILCWFDQQQRVLPGRVVASDNEHVLFEIDAAATGDDGHHGLWRLHYPRTAESIVWGREGEVTGAALQSAYALSTLSPMPTGPTGSQGPRLSAVWL